MVLKPADLVHMWFVEISPRWRLLNYGSISLLAVIINSNK